MNEEDYFKYYIQGSDHYLIPKDVFIELFQEMNNWKDTAKASEKAIKEAIEFIKKYKEVIDSAKALVNNVYNSLENPDKPIKFYEELLDILKEVEYDR